MKKNLKFWAVLVGLNLVPLVAMGEIASDGTDCETTNSQACEDLRNSKVTDGQKAAQSAADKAAAERSRAATAERQRKARVAASKKKAEAEAKVKSDAEAKLKAEADAKTAAEKVLADAKALADKAAADKLAADKAVADAKALADKAAADKLAAAAVPSPAPAVEPAPVPQANVRDTLTPVATSYAEDLNMVELRKVIPDFDATIEGGNPSNKLRLFGTIPSDCMGKFSFTSTSNDADLTGYASKGVGIRLRDLGGGRACVKDHHDKGHVCERNMECTRLSTYPGATVDLSRAGDVSVGLLVVNPNSDRGRVSIEDFKTEEPFRHVSVATISNKRAQDARDARERRVRQYRDQVQRCRKDADQLILARNALGGLASMGELKDGEFERISRELSRAELGSIAKRADKANGEDLMLLREELAAWSSTHPDDGDKAAIVCHRIALKYATTKGAGVEGFDSARETISECQGFEGLSETTSDRLASYQRDISVDRVKTLASQGMQNNFLFAPSWANLMMNLQQDVMGACSGMSASMEACSSVMNTYRSAAQLPQQAQQIDAQRARQYQELQAALGGVNSSAMPGIPGMPGQGLWAGGSFGAGTSGFMTGTPKLF